MYDLMDQNYCIFVPLDIAGLDVSSSTVIQRLTKAGLSLKPRHVARKSFCEWPRKDLGENGVMLDTGHIGQMP